MLFDVLLLSVVVVTAYLGPMLLRRGGPEQRTYGWMLVGNLALALTAFASRQSQGGSELSDLLGFVAIAAGVFLVMVPSMLRNVAHWAYRTDHMRLAVRLSAVREMLQPGMGAAVEQELFQSMFDVRSGRVDQAVAALLERRARAEHPLIRRRLDERIVMTYLYARRWQAAIEIYELMGAHQHDSASPGTTAEMVWAYCEADRLDQAARLMERLESSPLANEPIFVPLLQRARLVFLAFVGRTSAVDALVAPSGALGPAMPESVRHFWSGVARLRAGDRSGARVRLGEAARCSGRNRRVRELAEQRLGAIDEPGVAGPHEVPASVADMADLLADRAAASEAGGAVGTVAMMGDRGAPATIGLIVANVLVMALVWALWRSTDSVAALIRGGNLLAGVQVGEWWRLLTSMFLHVGVVHLILNMYGLWALGRIVEAIFGSGRFGVIYMTSGLVGAVASHYFSAAPVSAGASGAVLGLAGAILAELGTHRASYPRRWRNGLFRLLLILTAANVAIGFTYPAIDQGAHLGGLATGAVMALWLSRRLRVANAAPIRFAVAGLLVLFTLAAAWSGFAVATTSYTETVAKHGAVQRTLNGVTVDAPGLWADMGYELGDRTDMYIRFEIRAIDAVLPLSEALGKVQEREQSLAVASGTNSRGFDATAPADHTCLRMPEPWQSQEFRVLAEGAGEQRTYCVIIFGRVVDSGDELWVGSAYLPRELAGDLQPIFSSVLNSARRAQQP
jgi:membrane associated rhomboid family serine protease